MNRIEIPIHPKPAPRLTYQGKHTNNAKAYYKYKEAINLYCKSKGFVLSDRISITFYMPIPKSVTKKERAERLGHPHQFKPDLDNLIKAVKDALCEEDSSIYYYEKMEKIWSLEGKIIIENV